MADTLRTIDLPAELLTPQGESFHLVPQGEGFTGAFNPRPRSGGPRYMLWSCVLEHGALHDSPERDFRIEWEAFIHKLGGTSTAFRVFDPKRCLPRGKAAGLWLGQTDRTEYFRTDGGSSWSISTASRRVGGAGFCLVGADAPREANAVVLSGLVAGETVFRRGDLVEIGGNLHEIGEEAVADASGRSAVTLNNRLWKPALAGDMVNLTRPRGRFVMIDNGQGRSRRNMVTAAATLECIEVPYVE